MWLKVEHKLQTLAVYEDDKIISEFPICTAKNGMGEENGSEKTPRGWHYIRAKIGNGQPENTIFTGRRPTGEIYLPGMANQHPGRDWILTRIMWLCGLEPGKNRFKAVDTMKRYVYIHGTPDDLPMQTPRSKGCVIMRNQDIIKLFDQVKPGTKLLIE